MEHFAPDTFEHMFKPLPGQEKHFLSPLKVDAIGVITAPTASVKEIKKPLPEKVCRQDVVR